MHGPLPHVLISGPSYSGKTTLARVLATSLGYEVISARAVLRSLGGNRRLDSREELQAFGAEIDEATRGAWLAEAALDATGSYVAVDSVRTARQLRLCAEALGPHVVHVHLTASESVRATRLELRERDAFEEARSIDDIEAGPADHSVDALSHHADLVIQTDGLDSSGILSQITTALADG